MVRLGEILNVFKTFIKIELKWIEIRSYQSLRQKKFHEALWKGEFFVGVLMHHHKVALDCENRPYLKVIIRASR